MLERAPLHTGPLLQEHVFSGKTAVVMTSATMCVSTKFDYVKAQLGVTDCRERVLGSAFDYRTASAVFAPRDMPAPDAPAFQRTVERVLTDLAGATDGHGLALFTSYAALRNTYTAIKRPLEERGILVLAQGIDGQPSRLIEAFRGNPKALLLGAGTFWEGVDLGGADLRLLVITRLPFRVPTDPIVAARSESYDDPFNQYALPETILRFRQGFGRLIRTNRDHGVVVILDGRVVSKSYGRAFLDALPGVAAAKPALRDLPNEVGAWLGKRIG
jgi:DNA polymerase-3 subunit epsilon/ATP-dependent DNA helicase DinG